jgi:hypothetical protein
LDINAGLPQNALAYGKFRFCIKKYTKPAHEHHLQAFPERRQTFLFSNLENPDI